MDLSKVDTSVVHTAIEPPNAFLERPTTILARRSELHSLVAGTVVFRKHSLATACPETLLLCRSPNDTFPLRWEYAGGTFDETSDKTLVETALRELREETGLVDCQVICPIILHPSDDRNDAISGASTADDDLSCVFQWDNQAWGVATLLVECSDDDVKIDRAEHVDWAWVTEKEVRAGRFSNGDHRMEIVSKGMKDMILEGFRLVKVLKL